MTQQIEEELALLRVMVEDMSDMVARQGNDIARLTRRVDLLMQRAADSEQDATGAMVFGDERPPHY